MLLAEIVHGIIKTQKGPERDVAGSSTFEVFSSFL